MTAELRRAGAGRLGDGGIVHWSVADGRRGRRWRWTVLDGGDVRLAGLAELDPDGRFARLELASSAGMLTLHPAADGRSIHGNVVGDDGVRPLAFEWHPGAALALSDDPFGSAILSGGGEPEPSHEPLLTIRPRLGVLPGGSAPRLPVDPRGVPELAEAREWELEPD